MKSQKAFYQFATAMGLTSAILLQSACTGGGFNAQDAKLNERLEILTTPNFPTPTKTEVPEITTMEETPAAVNDNQETPEQVLDDAGNVVPALSVCSPEYVQKHNEIHQILLQLSAYESSEKSEQQTELAIVQAVEADQKCQAFIEKFAGLTCRAKLTADGNEVLASYRFLLKEECEKVAAAVKEVQPGNQSINPLVDLSGSPEVLQQELSVLMNQENQIVEVGIPSMIAFEAESNINQDITKIWKAGENKSMSFDKASAEAVEAKSNFCAVSGFTEIKGPGTVTHRMMQVETADAGTGLKSGTIHFTSYLAGMGAGDEANGWTIRCFGPADSFKVNLQLLKDVFGTNLETEVVGPQ